MKQPFSVWLDDFFTSYYRHRPVNATFIGMHDHDHMLPDYSPQGGDAAMSEMASLLRRLDDGSIEPPQTPDGQTDRTLAANFLKIQQWEYESRHFRYGNPSVYAGEAVFSIIALFLHPFAPAAERAESAIARMEAMPMLLTQAEANVQTAPPAWTARAIREAEGAIRFFGNGVDLLMATEGITTPRFRAAADRARAAVAQHQDHLRTRIAEGPQDRYGCGEEAFEMYIRDGHLLDSNGIEIERYARAQFADARGALDAGARQFGVRAWRDALAMLADVHPTIEEYYGRYQEVWDACRATAEAHDLITWPDFPIRYVPRPVWARECAPYLYFLHYYTPAPYDRMPVHDYLVTPIEPMMAADEQVRLLRATNDCVIKLNHVIHHGSIGHHVQNAHVPNAPSRIGRISGVDCAARIAMFCAGTLVEGWASYVVDLLDEVGFLTPLEHYSQHYARLRASARAIVDVNLHYGRFSLGDAIAFYRDEAGMTDDAARSEAVKNSMFPGAAMMYLIGQDLIRDLRREIAAREGANFSLRRFHDGVLSYGAIPASLIAARMRGVRSV
ncbi:MAG: DUF885 domain-containing protein [Thermomicrobiales bacterium]